MKIALAQINPIVGDFEYNLNKILEYVRIAGDYKANLIIFPELSVCGYPPKDLLLKKQFIEDSKKYLNLLKDKITSDILLVVGFPEENKDSGRPLFDSLALVQNKKIIATRQKTLLPTYDVFDEDRYFEPAKEIKSVNILGKNVGLTICEDIWQSELVWTKPRYQIDPIKELTKAKTDLIVNASASPYFFGKHKLRESLLKDTAKKYKLPVVYVNQVGGNDELIFDGNSCVIDEKGETCLKLKAFEEDLKIVELDDKNQIIVGRDIPTERLYNDNEELLQAIILGLRDYLRKCGFKKVIVGLSGGIDSSLVAALAVYALGKENVLGVSMPSRYTSEQSIKDTDELTANLGIGLLKISIEEPFEAFLNLLLPIWGNRDSSLAEENIQSRIRGVILMALSNQSGALVLSTGNKSELATGYCTLYGDMCGGLAVISDLPKITVYELSKYINKKEGKEIIPKSILTRPPTAELKLNQTDQDVLPAYEVLDKVLNAYVEEHMPLKEIIKKGVDKETALKVCNMIDVSEYKRQQAAPSLKLTSRSFGYGWRMPIAQRYKETI